MERVAASNPTHLVQGLGASVSPCIEENELQSLRVSSFSLSLREEEGYRQQPDTACFVGGGVRIHPENARMSGRHGVQYVAECVACAALTLVVWQ